MRLCIFAAMLLSLPNRLLANETLSITEPPNGSLADVSLTLDMLSVPDAAAGYPFLRASSDGNSQENPQGRKLLQTGKLAVMP